MLKNIKVEDDDDEATSSAMAQVPEVTVPAQFPQKCLLDDKPDAEGLYHCISVLQTSAEVQQCQNTSRVKREVLPEIIVGEHQERDTSGPLPTVRHTPGPSVPPLSKSIPPLSKSIPSLSKSIPPLSKSMPPLSKSSPRPAPTSHAYMTRSSGSGQPLHRGLPGYGTSLKNAILSAARTGTAVLKPSETLSVVTPRAQKLQPRRTRSASMSEGISLSRNRTAVKVTQPSSGGLSRAAIEGGGVRKFYGGAWKTLRPYHYAVQAVACRSLPIENNAVHEPEAPDGAADDYGNANHASHSGSISPTGSQ